MNYFLDNVEAVAKHIIDTVSSKTLVFKGEMGVGKTTLIKNLVKALGSDDEVSSPTFSIVNEYVTETETIFHFDLYRIKSFEEALNFGIDDYLYSGNWCLIEWPELVEHYLPDDYCTVEIVLNQDGSRTLKIKHNQLSNNTPNPAL